MKKRVNATLTINLTYFPEDLGLDNNASRNTLIEAAGNDIDDVIRRIETTTSLIVDEISIEVCEVK